MKLLLQLSNFHICSFNLSEDNGRISLSTPNNKSCQLTIKGIKFEDNGEWIFSLQFQQNKTIKKNSHHILVRHNGKLYHFRKCLILCLSSIKMR